MPFYDHRTAISTGIRRTGFGSCRFGVRRTAGDELAETTIRRLRDTQNSPKTVLAWRISISATETEPGALEYGHWQSCAAVGAGTEWHWKEISHLSNSPGSSLAAFSMNGGAGALTPHGSQCAAWRTDENARLVGMKAGRNRQRRRPGTYSRQLVFDVHVGMRCTLTTGNDISERYRRMTTTLRFQPPACSWRRLYERRLDEHFARWFAIAKATRGAAALRHRPVFRHRVTGAVYPRGVQGRHAGWHNRQRFHWDDQRRPDGARWVGGGVASGCADHTW